ncbi:hypothetical protein ACTFIY_012059 [Dictyostelium cf. discoideum]
MNNFNSYDSKIINNFNYDNKYIAILNIEKFQSDIKNFYIYHQKNLNNSEEQDWKRFNNCFKRMLVFMREVCDSLSLSSLAYLHSISLLKRFLNRKFIFDYNQYFVSMTCILICIKVNSSSILPMKVRDLLNVSYYILANERLLLNDDYYNFKDNILSMEQKILQILSYDISVSFKENFAGIPNNNDNNNNNCVGKIIDEAPPYLFHFLYFLDCEKNHVLSQISFNFLNDSSLIPFIESPFFKAPEIALFCILLAFEYTKIDLPLSRNNLFLILGLKINNNNNNNDNNNNTDLNDQKYENFKNNGEIHYNNNKEEEEYNNKLISDFFKKENKKD